MNSAETFGRPPITPNPPTAPPPGHERFCFLLTCLQKMTNAKLSLPFVINRWQPLHAIHLESPIKL